MSWRDRAEPLSTPTAPAASQGQSWRQQAQPLQPVQPQTPQAELLQSDAPASLGERFRVNVGEGFEGTLAGQAAQNVRNQANVEQAQANTLADLIGQMQATGAVNAPATMPNPAQGGAPSPEGPDYLGVGVETQMPGIGTGDLAGQSEQALAAEYFRRMLAAEEGQREYDEARAPVLERRQNMPSWYEEEGALGKGVAGAAALAGQLVGGTPSPENLLAFGRGANVAQRFGRGAAGGAAGAGVAEPVVQQQEVRRGEREETSVAEGAFNVALGGLLGGVLNVTPDAARSLRNAIARRKNKPVADVTPDDLGDVTDADLAELLRQVEMTNEGQRLTPEELGEIIRANTGQDARPQVGEGLDPRQRNAARRAQERELGALFEGAETDVLRRQDVEVGDEGVSLREGAEPLRDPTGRQASPDDYGSRAAVQRVVEEDGVRLSEQNFNNAAREIQQNPDADPRAIVRSYSDEARSSAFELAQSRRQRREGDLADGERVDQQASTYRAGETPFERAPQRAVTLLDAQRDRNGQLTGGESVEVLARDRQLNAQGEAEEIVRIRIGDDEPVWVPASRLSEVETPENPRMAAEARSQTREPPRGVMTERGDGPEGAPSQTPQPRRAGDRISDPQGLRRGQFQEAEAPQGQGPTARAEEPPVSEQGGQTSLPRRPQTSDSRDVTPQGERRTESQGQGGQMEVETTRRPVRETTRAQEVPAARAEETPTARAEQPAARAETEAETPQRRSEAEEPAVRTESQAETPTARADETPAARAEEPAAPTARAEEPAARAEAETETPAQPTRTVSNDKLAKDIEKAKTGAQLLDAIEAAVPDQFRPLFNVLRASGIVQNVPVRNNRRMRGAEGQHSISLSGTRADVARGQYASIAKQEVIVNPDHIARILDGTGETRLSGDPQASVAQIMLHELTHAATVRAMGRDTPKRGGRVGSGSSVDAAKWSQWEPSEKAEAIRRRLAAAAEKEGLDPTVRANLLSATENARETVAWGMTNPEVMDVLKDLPAISKRNRSLFKDFVDAVRQALGLTTKHRSALSDLAETTAELIAETNAGSTRILNPLEASTTITDSVTARELQARKDAQRKGALVGDNAKQNKETLETAFQRATGLGSRDAKRWASENERLFRSIREAAERRRSGERESNTKFWQRGSIASRFHEVTFGSLDGEMRALAARNDSPMLEAIADVFHAEAGRAKGVGRTFSERESQHLNTRARDVQRIQQHLDDNRINTTKDMNDIIEMVEDPRKPRKGPKGEAARQIETWFADELAYQRKAGVEIGEVDDYFARHTDPGKISGGVGHAKKEDRFKTQAAKAYQEMGLNEVDAKEAAQDLLNRILGIDLDAKPGAAQLSGGAPTRNVKGRSFTAAAAKHLDEFRDKDIPRVMSRYLMGSTKRAEIARSEITLPNGETIAFGDRFSNMGEIMRALEEDGVAAADITNVQNLIAVNTGVQGASRSAGLMKFSTTVRTMGALAFMDRAALSSIPELMTGALRTTTGNPVQDLGRIASSLVTDLDSAIRKSFTGLTGVDVRNQRMVQARELAEDFGIIAGDSVSYLMSARFIGDDASGPLLQRVQTGFFRNTGLTALNDYTRVKTVRLGDTFLRRLAKDVTAEGNTRKNNSGAYFLREAGVPKGQEKAFSEWMVRHFNDDMPTSASLSRMTGRDAEYAEMYRTGIQRITDQSVMRPDATTKPRWASHPVGAMAFHLLSFTWAFQKNVINRWGRMATDSDLATLDKLMMLPGLMGAGAAMFGLSYAANEVRDQLTEMTSTREQTPRTAGADLERAFSYTGFTGKVDPLLQMFSGTRYQRSVAETIMGAPLGLMTGSVDDVLAAALNNSENTNTAERNLARALHQTLLTPALQAGLALGPGFGIPGMIVGGATIAGARATRDPFVDTVGGEEDPDSVRRRTSNPVRSIFEGEDSTPSGGSSGSRSAGGRSGSRTGSRSGGREASR